MQDLSPDWQYVADTVMGGVSQGRLRRAEIAGRMATELTGRVSLDNNGGFVQMAFDLPNPPSPEAGAIEFEVIGNGARYDMRLRTDRLTRPWQSFRTEFVAPQVWTTLRLEFAAFVPHRTEAAFEPGRLRRIGILAVGREMQAQVAVAAIRFVP